MEALSQIRVPPPGIALGQVDKNQPVQLRIVHHNTTGKFYRVDLGI